MKKPAVRWAVIGLIVLLGVVWFLRRGRGEKPEGDAPVETVKVERGEIRATVVATGVIEPETSVDVKANAGGEVTELFVDVGDRVRKGDLLAVIDPEDSQTAVRTATADLRAATANVRQAEAASALERNQTPARELNAAEAIRVARAQLRQAEQNLTLQRSTAATSLAEANASLRAAEARVGQAEVTRTQTAGTTSAAVVQARQAEAEAASRVAQAEENLAYQREVYETALARAQQGRNAAEARLDQARLQANTGPAQAQAAVREAEAALTASRQQLERLRTASLPAATAGARGEFEAARTALANAESNVRRQQELLGKGYVPQTAVEEAQETAAAARSRFQVAQETLNNLQAQQRTEVAEAEAEVERAEASLARAQQAERATGTTALDVQAAQAELQQAQAAVQEAQAGTRQVELRRQELVAARAALERAAAATRSAEAQELEVQVRGGAVEEARAGRRQAEAARSEAVAQQRQVDVRAAQVAAAQAQLRQAEANYQSVRAERFRLPQREAEVVAAGATVARRQAEVANAEEQLRDTTIRAPRDGVVIERFVEEGTIITSGRSSVTEGTQILTLADISDMYCLAEVDESDVAKVKTGQRAMMQVEAFPDQEFLATVRKVYPRGVEEEDVTLFTVELQVEGVSGTERGELVKELRPGMTADIEILTEVHQDVLIVPADVVREGPQGYVVQVMRNGKPEDVPIEVGIQTSDSVEVRGGLREGEDVVKQAARGGEEGKGGKGGGGDGKKGNGDRQREFQKTIRGSMKGMMK